VLNLKNEIFIKGQRISLRPVVEKDAGYYKWFNDPAITRHSCHGLFPNSQEKQKTHIREMNKSSTDLQLGIIINGSGQFIGVVGLHQIDWSNKRADISIIIGEKKFWGRGYASEVISLLLSHAFGKMGLHKVTAGMTADNVPSTKAFEKNGFKKDGRLRDHFAYQDRWVDMISMSLLSKEYFKFQSIKK
jgi:[ribosomal protein S5]-alanine N-acetyltransferase